MLYDPQFDVVTDVIPCEDAYAQERSLLDEVLKLVVTRDLILADRNFCTIGFLFGIARATPSTRTCCISIVAWCGRPRRWSDC
ncbi:MAG: hypothetical protein ACLQNE_12990 [Thermoguttaceae bacterium]